MRLPSMEGFRMPLRVVFYKENQSWIAHCLEFDLIGDGLTQQAAIECLVGAIAAQIGASLEFDNPDNLFSPADAKFFAMFAKGKNIGKGELTLHLQEVRPVVESLDAREYVAGMPECALA